MITLHVVKPLAALPLAEFPLDAIPHVGRLLLNVVDEKNVGDLSHKTILVGHVQLGLDNLGVSVVSVCPY